MLFRIAQRSCNFWVHRPHSNTSESEVAIAKLQNKHFAFDDILSASLLEYSVPERVGIKSADDAETKMKNQVTPKQELCQRKGQSSEFSLSELHVRSKWAAVESSDPYYSDLMGVIADKARS
ncbi:MAG: hypothetical protein GY820_28595 [Gammaproteobacteria bacterium]|nr:hypothetical protein [Gammaproteobacteria bacterium]